MTSPSTLDLEVEILQVRSFIDGQWVRPTERLDALRDPNTGAERQGQLGVADADVERALRAADALYASGALEAAGIETRASVLDALAARIDEHAEAIARQDSMSTGNPITTTRLLASYLSGRVRSAVQQVRDGGDGRSLGAEGRPVRLLNRPLGPVLVLAPWNAPTFVALSKISAAIAAGCPVILKPSEWAPGGAQIVAGLLADAIEASSLPPATFQLLHGGSHVGARLSSDSRVRVITFTGGLDAGRAVAAAAARNLAVVQLELGSNNPVVVMPDADLTRTARSLIAGVTRLNGQWCEAPGKVLVPQPLHDELVDALIEESRGITVGHCLDPETTLGPIAYKRHFDRLGRQVAGAAAAGASVSAAGQLPDLRGWFMSPTIISELDAAAATEEIFGPVLTVHSTKSTDDAIAAANRSGGGLDAFVFGTDVEAALEVGARLRAGEVRVNGTHMADLADGSEQTFWETSGVGGHGPANAVPFYQGRRVVGLDDDDLPI